MALSEERYILFTTFRRSGTPVPTTVWIAPLGPGLAGFSTSSATGKVKRLRHTSRVIVQPCNGRGAVRRGSAPIEATARLADAAELATIRERLAKKYGVARRVIAAGRLVMGLLGRPVPESDVGVVIELPPSDPARA